MFNIMIIIHYHNMVLILAVHPDNSTDLIEENTVDCGILKIFERHNMNACFGYIDYYKPSDGCTLGKYERYIKDGAIYDIFVNRVTPKCRRWHKHIDNCYSFNIANSNAHVRILVPEHLDKYEHCIGDFYLVKRNAETKHLMDMTQEEYVEMFEFFSKLKK